MISPDESQPITFAGDRWRDYIPIALPWTVCVRERLPPGSVAVLINRSHTFTDLILTVDSFEDRLLGAIDGKRTLAEILQIAARGEQGRAPRREFLRAPLAIRPDRLRRVTRRVNGGAMGMAGPAAARGKWYDRGVALSGDFSN